MNGFYKYVPHHKIEKYLADGWELAVNFGTTHHSHYSVLMYWPKDTEPPKSKKTGKA